MRTPHPAPPPPLQLRRRVVGTDGYSSSGSSSSGSSSGSSSSGSSSSSRLTFLLLIVSSAVASPSAFWGSAGSIPSHPTAFQGRMMLSPSSTSSSSFGRGLPRRQAAGGGDKSTKASSSSSSTSTTSPSPATSTSSTTNSPRPPVQSIPSRLLAESAAAGAAAAAATGAGAPSFTLSDLLQRDRQAVTSLPPAPPQDMSQDKEMLEELTHMFYRAVNERNSDMLRKIWLEEEMSSSSSSSVVLSAGDGNVTMGYDAVVDWLNVLRKEERRLDPGKKGLMLCPTTDISDLRVCVNGLHAWVTCKEVMARGLLSSNMQAYNLVGNGGLGGGGMMKEVFCGTNVWRKWNGQWRLLSHFSGRLASVQEELSEYLEYKKMKDMAGGRGGKGGRGGAGGQQNIQRIPLRPEDLGLPPGMEGEAEITWEIDDDVFEVLGEEGAEGYEVAGFDDGKGNGWMEVELKEGEREGGKEGEREGEQRLAAATLEDLAGSLLEWNRSAVFRKKTKKALSAVRKLFMEGRLTEEEKMKLIYSVVYATSQEEVSQVELAYDLLVKEYDDEAEFSEQLKLILNSLE
ncbi:Hypothetical protein NocV09_00403760 [Nannochloropsis oceanica]